MHKIMHKINGSLPEILKPLDIFSGDSSGII